MDSKITVAVTGASGLLGRPLMKQLETDGRFRVRGAAWTRAGDGLDRIDLTDPAAVDDWLDEVKPEVLIHLAAERRPDVYAKDPVSADRLNIDATKYLAMKCAAQEVNLLFLSTNYVFDGTMPPYHPEDRPNPLNAYGRGKLAGERAVTAASANHRVLRIPMLHGPSEKLEESSVTVIAGAFIGSAGPVALDVRQTRFPAYAPDVARAVIGLIPGLSAATLPGPILHFCPKESFTKRDMGEIMAALVGADPGRAVADERLPEGAPRPENVGMVCPHLEAMGLMKTTAFREAVRVSLRLFSAP